VTRARGPGYRYDPSERAMAAARGTRITPGQVDFTGIDYLGEQPVLVFSDVTQENRASVMIFRNGAWEYLGKPGFSPGAANQPCLAVIRRSNCCGVQGHSHW